MKSGRPKIVQMAYQRLRANVNCLQHAEQKMHLISSFLHIFLLISLCVFIATIFSFHLLFSQLLFFYYKIHTVSRSLHFIIFSPRVFLFFVFVSSSLLLTQANSHSRLLLQRCCLNGLSNTLALSDGFVRLFAQSHVKSVSLEMWKRKTRGVEKKKWSSKFMERFFEFCEWKENFHIRALWPKLNSPTMVSLRREEKRPDWVAPIDSEFERGFASHYKFRRKRVHVNPRVWSVCCVWLQ